MSYIGNSPKVKSLRIEETSGTDKVTLSATTVTSPYTLNLPATQGGNTQVLLNDGSGNLGWATAATTVGNVAANDSNVTFTNADNRTQVCTPTAARTYTLPTTSIVAGDTWYFYNDSTTTANTITINSSGGNLITTIGAGGYVKLVALVSTPTTAANWKKAELNTSWISYTPTVTGLGTVTNMNSYYKIVNDSLSARVQFRTGTASAVVISMSLPSGISINTNKIPSAITSAVGIGGDSQVNNIPVMLVDPSTSTTLFYVGIPAPSPSASAIFQKQVGSSLFNPGVDVSFNVTDIPI